MIVVSERSVLKRGKRNERGINANEVPEKGPKEIRDTVTCCNTNCMIADNSLCSINGCDARACTKR